MVRAHVPPPDRVLLVEGQDDFHVVRQICERNPIMPNFDILPQGGKDRLLKAIGPELNAEGRKAVGILMDADDDLDAQWQAIVNRLLQRARMYDHFSLSDLPAHPVATGAIIESTGMISDAPLRIGIWLMPDNRSTGELEDFVGSMIPAADPVWPRSQDYIDGIPHDDRKFSPGKTQRAKVHAWLAARETPRPMGLSIRAGDLDTNASNTTTFVNWLRELFKEMA